MRARSEARFCVGSKSGSKSSIWKVWVQGDEAYIASRMFGSELKISLHSSGLCQWSMTDSWMTRTGVTKNSDRHIVRWRVPEQADLKANLIFRVQIPISELRQIDPPLGGKRVFWISGAPEGSTIQFAFYITPRCDDDPALYSELPHRHLFSVRFRGGSWLVALVDVIALSASDLLAAKSAIRNQVNDKDLILNSSHRACAFMQPSEDSPAGLLELCFD